MSKLMKLDIQFFSDEGVDIAYTNIYDGDNVVQVKVEITDPTMLDGEITGYAVFEPVDGWELSENNTKLTRIYDSNFVGNVALKIIGTYDVESGETMPFPSVIDTYADIQITNIMTEEYLTIYVSYNNSNSGSDKSVDSATITVTMTDDSSYYFSSENEKNGWTISDNGTEVQKTITANDNYIETLSVYPKGEADSEVTRTTASISYLIDKVGLSATPVISYEEKVSDGDVIGVTVSIVIPYTIGSSSGYEEISGRQMDWILSENKTRITKTYTENTNEIVTVYTRDAESDDVHATNSEYQINVVVNQINYKKIVKGRCDMTMCFYDVYTKAEMENFKLKSEEEKKLLQSEIQYLNDQVTLLWDMLNGNIIVNEGE